MSGGNWKVLPSTAEKDAHILAIDKLYGYADAAGKPTPQPPSRFIGFTAPGKVETEVPPGFSLTVPGPGWTYHAVGAIPHPTTPDTWAVIIPDDTASKLASDGAKLTAQESAKITTAIATKAPLDATWSEAAVATEPAIEEGAK